MLRLLTVWIGLVLLLSPSLAGAACPEDCPLSGGGRSDTDCLLEFGGVEPRRPGSRVVECADGDPVCDLDGTVDGQCTFAVTACVNNSDPDLPSCSADGVDLERVRVRGGGMAGRNLRQAIGGLLPASGQACTDPVDIAVRIRGQSAPELGTRRFSLAPTSSFQINTLPVGFFQGEMEMHAGAPDADTGLAEVDIVSSSDFIYADLSQLAGLILCIKPITPAPAAGLILCGRRSGEVMRISARGTRGGDRVVDRDALALICKPSVQFGNELSINHNIGVVGENDFTAEDCAALGGTVEGPEDLHPGVCNGPFEAMQLPDIDTSPGALLVAPVPELGLIGFPAELTQESALPCGDEPSGGMSLAFAFTTETTEGRIENWNNQVGVEPLDFSVTGENFSCRRFDQEDGPGKVTLAAPQLHLPFLGDGVTLFTFSDR